MKNIFIFLLSLETLVSTPSWSASSAAPSTMFKKLKLAFNSGTATDPQIFAMALAGNCYASTQSEDDPQISRMGVARPEGENAIQDFALGSILVGQVREE